MDARVASSTRLVFPEMKWEQVPVSEELRRQTARFVCSHFERSGPEETSPRELIFHLHGPYGVGKHALAEAVCSELGIPLLVGDLEKISNLAGSFEETIWLLGREAALQQAALCFENFDCLTADETKNSERLRAVIHTLRTFSTLTFLLGKHAWNPRGVLEEQTFIELALPVPEERGRKEAWLRECAERDEFSDDVDWDALAGKFRFTPGQIRDAAATARDRAAWRAPDDKRLTLADLHAACRAHSNPKLATLAQKIQPKYRWADIILPADRLHQLREICNYVKYRALVYQEWGFDHKLSLGKGLNVLFAGPSGTGKTMSAEIMAGELGLDLYKIDLSTVVSKYIGETEKNLRRVFDAAESGGAVLLFDEADALFGRRSEVKDSHDRYANIEVSYLLQRMESYRGLAILTTNLKSSVDTAFMRRLRFVVQFPFPDAAHRAEIWSRMFPTSTPTDGSDAREEHSERRSPYICLVKALRRSGRLKVIGTLMKLTSAGFDFIQLFSSGSKSWQCGQP